MPFYFSYQAYSYLCFSRLSLGTTFPQTYGLYEFENKDSL